MSRLPPGRVEIRRDLLALGTGAAILFFLFLGARDLWNPNEPTYGQAVVEMAARGDWLVPTVNGKIFGEKPILYYWMARLAAAALGRVDEFTLRVPSALAGLLAVLGVYALVFPYAGRARARIASALFATTYMVFWGSRSVQMDILVAATTLGVVLAVSRVVDHEAPALRGWVLAGAAAGLGFLAKGPVGWICPGIVLVLYLLATRRPGRLATPAVGAGVAVAVAIAAGWVLALLLRGEAGLIEEALFRQNVQRVLAPWDHQAPWWYYFQYFWIDLAPWSWLVPLAAALPDRDAEERRLDTLAWLWIAGVVVFFSLSPSKRSPYILPIAPAVAVLASGVAERTFDGRLRGARLGVLLAMLASAGGVLVASGVGVWWRLVPAYPEVSGPAKALGVLCVAGGAAILGSVASRGRRVVAGTALFSLVVCLYLLAAVSVLPAADVFKSTRPFCERFNAIVGPHDEIASYRFWDWRAGYAFYGRRPIRNLDSAESLAAYWERPERVFLIVEEGRLAEARAVIGARDPLVQAGVGGKEVFLFSNEGGSVEHAAAREARAGPGE